MFHPLLRSGNLGVVVHDAVLADSTTHNIDLTTEDDGVTSSGVPSEACIVSLAVNADSESSGDPLFFTDGTNANMEPVGWEEVGPNCWYPTAALETFFIEVLTKSDGSVDLTIPAYAANPTVEISVLGYKDCDVHGHSILTDTLGCDCTFCDCSEAWTVNVEDSGGSPIGGGWHKLAVVIDLGYRYYGGTYHYPDDPRMAAIDLADDDGSAANTTPWTYYLCNADRGANQCGSNSSGKLKDAVSVASDSANSQIKMGFVCDSPGSC
jgi:hypothetical protein